MKIQIKELSPFTDTMIRALFFTCEVLTGKSGVLLYALTMYRTL